MVIAACLFIRVSITRMRESIPNLFIQMFFFFFYSYFLVFFLCSECTYIAAYKVVYVEKKSKSHNNR